MSTPSDIRSVCGTQERLEKRPEMNITNWGKSVVSPSGRNSLCVPGTQAESGAVERRCRGRSPHGFVSVEWLRCDGFNDDGKLNIFERHRLICEAHFIPQTIIDGEGEERRTCGHLFMVPGPDRGAPHDHVLRTIWPRTTDRIQIRQRVYRILAVHRIVDGGEWGHAYRVDLR